MLIDFDLTQLDIDTMYHIWIAINYDMHDNQDAVDDAHHRCPFCTSVQSLCFVVK